MLDSLDAVSRPNIGDGSATLLAGGLGVTGVLLSEIEKSLDSLLVCDKELANFRLARYELIRNLQSA